MGQTVKYTGFTGITQTGTLFSLTSDTVIETKSATEATNDKGGFSISFTSNATGVHILNIKDGDNKTIGRFFVTLAGEDGTATAYDYGGPAAEGSEAPSAAEVATAVDNLLSAAHGEGAWGSEDSPLVLANEVVTSVISQKVVVLGGISSNINHTFMNCMVKLIDVSESSAVAVNALASWNSTDKQLTLISNPPFALAAGDKVILLAWRDPMTSPTGRYVYR